MQDVETLEKQHAEIDGARKKLKTNPDDPKANSSVGQFLCFAKGEWDSGLQMLVRGNDQPLKELAERELLIPTTPEDQVKLGDDWWTISEKYEGRIKRMLMEHAQQFYLAALPDLSGLTEASSAQKSQRLGCGPFTSI